MWAAGAFFGVVLLGALWLLLQYLSDRSRAGRFKARNAPTFDQWYEQYYGEAKNLCKSNVERVVRVFGEALGVEPTRLMPSDRLIDEYSINHPLVLDDVWDVVDAMLSHEFRRDIKWRSEWATLDDVIRGVCTQLG
jgi:hypothetical protein